MPTWRETVNSWRQPAHAVRFADQLATSGLDAVFWETSRSRTGDEAFEGLLLPAPELVGIEADSRPFAEQLTRPVNTFSNLGRDAVLVAPGSPGDHAHLARFVRTAPMDAQRALWTATADAIETWWAGSQGDLWVSTSGLGVAWLHVRLDGRPKYYVSRLRN